VAHLNGILVNVFFHQKTVLCEDLLGCDLVFAAVIRCDLLPGSYQIVVIRDLNLGEDLACIGVRFVDDAANVVNGFLYAFNKLKNAPNTPEFNKLRTQLTYDLNNNTAISMILNLLLNDEDIKEDLINQKEFVFRR